MLWRSSILTKSGIRATDGSIGSIDDLLFEDTDWSIRWVVVDTGTWLSGRKVLLPPSALQQAGAAPQEFSVNLTRKQVEDSPPLDSDAPVSRQHEASIYDYYGWSPYWYPGAAGYPGYAMPLGGFVPIPGEGTMAGPPGAPREVAEALAARQENADPSLRSAREVTGYYIKARDGDIGHVEDLMVEEESWTIRYVVVDTVNWWPGRKVLVAVHWFHDVNWGDHQVQTDLTRDEIRNSPEYAPGTYTDRGYEERLFGHYGRPPYWTI
jgi:hypothetical protein